MSPYRITGAWVKNAPIDLLQYACGGGVDIYTALYISVFPKNLRFSPISKEIEKKEVLLTQFHEKRVHLALFLATINVHAITRYILINLKFHLITSFQGCMFTKSSKKCIQE